MNQNQIIKASKAAYDALAELDHKHWTAYRTALFNLCKAEEKDHRGFIPSTFNDYHPHSASLADCARMFAVKRIAEYLNGDPMPKGRDYLHFHKSAFYAAGLVDEFGDEIRQAWKDFNIAELAEMDYVELVEPGENTQSEIATISQG